MSHAYVEVEDQRIAGAILRGEAAAAVGRKKGEQRGSVLGKGRRARGVTVTRSCQSELMTDVSPSPSGDVFVFWAGFVDLFILTCQLFPHWKGGFEDG